MCSAHQRAGLSMLTKVRRFRPRSDPQGSAWTDVIACLRGIYRRRIGQPGNPSGNWGRRVTKRRRDGGFEGPPIPYLGTEKSLTDAYDVGTDVISYKIYSTRVGVL
jgi:hypothetical protein